MLDVELIDPRDSKKLDVHILATAKNDIRTKTPNPIDFGSAVRFIFLEDDGEGHPFSFTAICEHLHRDSERYAEKFWNRLSPATQKRVLDYLKGISYTSWPTVQ